MGDERPLPLNHLNHSKAGVWAPGGHGVRVGLRVAISRKPHTARVHNQLSGMSHNSGQMRMSREDHEGRDSRKACPKLLRSGRAHQCRLHRLE